MAVEYFYNSKQIRVSVYRGTPRILIFGPIGLFIEPLSISKYLAERQMRLPETTRDSIPTDVVRMKHKLEGTVYVPQAEDYLIVSNSPDGLFDGSFVVKEIPNIFTQNKKRLDYIELNVLRLAPTKQGDSGGDNSGKIRLGQR